MEEKVRKLLFNLDIIAKFAKAEEIGTNSPISKNVIDSLQLIKELKEDIGYLEDKNRTKLKQSKLFF